MRTACVTLPASRIALGAATEAGGDRGDAETRPPQRAPRSAQGSGMVQGATAKIERDRGDAEARRSPSASVESRRERDSGVTSPRTDAPAGTGARGVRRRAAGCRKLLLLAPALLLAACASVPTGPSAMALPGSKSSFERFRADDFDCQRFAASRVGGKTRDDVAVDAGVKSAVVGAAIGAAAGAAIDGASGAAVGAGLGAATGALVGADAAGYSSGELQRRYDEAYLQCMYAKGHKVPVYGDFASPYERPRASRGYYPPPPPPGWR